MPWCPLNVQILRAASRAQKSALVADITHSLVEHLGKKPEHLHIVIQEIADEDWGYAGQLSDEGKRAQGAQAPCRSAPVRDLTFPASDDVCW